MKKRIDKMFLIASAVIGFFLGIIGEFLYKADINGWKGRIPYIVIYLLVFVILMGVVLLFKGLKDNAFVNFGKVMLYTLLSLILFLGASALFEFLYELGGTKQKQLQATDIQYVFLIDDSGSMDTNDNENKRYDAVETIIRSMSPTNQFAVYRFASETDCSTPINTVNSKEYTFDRSNVSGGGGTYLLSAIDEAIEDVADPRNIHTKIIVLTDGAPSDNIFGKYGRVVKKAVKKNASVSSVGFGSPNEQFLTELADNTGGVYVFSDNISSLTDNLETIVKAQTSPLGKNRDLLGYRLDSTSDNFFYGLMRVVFLVLLGAVWSFIKVLLVGKKRSAIVSTVFSLVLCSLAAILCELFLLLGVPDAVVRILFCTMWACTLIQERIYERVNFENVLHSSRGNDISGDKVNDLNDVPKEVSGPKSFL